MKNKLLLIIPFLICGYGFLPVSFHYNRKNLKNPNTIIIRHQECGCPCPNAYLKEGQLIIPNDILNTFRNIDKKEINLSGKDPFEPYDPELAGQDIMITGKVVGVDTSLCTPSDCEIVPIFKVDKWYVSTYYPRFWIQGIIFLYTFLISIFLSAIIVLYFIGLSIKNVFFFSKESPPELPSI